MIGGAEGTRTPDVLHAMQVLYQLSYSPNGNLQGISRSPGPRGLAHQARLRTVRTGRDNFRWAAERGAYARPTMTDADVRHDEELPPYRYDARLANEIEAKWQDRWESEHTFWAPNPSGPLSEGFDAVADRMKLFALDMFPYPSGAGLHVGHPLGYIGTDVYARFKRMTGHNVLHAMGYDAFGLPAEQYAVQTGQHPRVTTEDNVATMRRQLRALGLGHDPRRSVATTDPAYYRWTQWIFLQLFESWYDEDEDRGAADRGPDPAARSRSRGRLGRALGPRAARGRRREPARLPRRGTSQLVSRAGHGAGQRGSDCRRAAASGGTTRCTDVR